MRHEGALKMSVSIRVSFAGAIAVCLLALGGPGAWAGAPAAVPDAEIRTGTGTFVGDNIFNSDATAQSVNNSGVIGSRLTFVIRIRNDGAAPAANGFKVKRSGPYHAGYRVRYFDAANNDVTGRVANGTFRTPSLAPGA